MKTTNLTHFVIVLLAALIIASPLDAQGMKKMKPMESMMAGDAPVVPPVTGYSEGQTVLFIHCPR